MRRLILRSLQSPGDVLMLTAAVRDLHAAAPGQFQTDVRTSAPALWENNPHITSLKDSEAGVETLDMHYPLIHQSNQRPYHFLHGYPQYLEERLGLRIPVTKFGGDIHLSESEKLTPSPGNGDSLPHDFWIVVAGGKYDFTAKWWDPAGYQAVVDHFKGTLTFVQIGETGHWHPKLRGVVDLIGKTTTRQLIHLMHHAAGVVCPVTFAMHLAAAVPTKPGKHRLRPCVVVAGGREPAHWEAYPGHQVLSTVGMLTCCAEGGCWKSRCQLVGDGDDKDRNNLCEQPVQVTPSLRIAKCMTLITPADIIRKIELFQNVSANGTGNGVMPRPAQPQPIAALPEKPDSRPRRKVMIHFPHGLGDAVQLGIVLRHLRKHHPDWEIDVHCRRGKHTALRGLCHAVYHDQEPRPNKEAYEQVFDLGWYECYSAYADSPCTKPSNCLRDVFGIKPELDLYSYVLQPEPADYAVTARYLESIGCTKGSSGRFNAVVLHYEGNTSTHKKNLSQTTAAALCETIRAAGHVPVILDWDRRSPLPDQKKIFCPEAGPADLWGNFGSGDAARITAIVSQAALFVGIDSGPGKCAGATETPSVIVWTGHHPIQFHDLCPNTTHFVPENHETIPPAQNRPAQEFFASHYAFQTYAPQRLTEELCAYVGKQLGGSPADNKGLVHVAGFWCHADRVEQDWTVIDDVFVKDCYKTALLSDVSNYRVAVDVGAHIGTFARHWATRAPACKIICLECAPENIEPLQRNAGEIATILHAACVGEGSGPLELLNAFTPPGLSRSTGGSMLVQAGQAGPEMRDSQYRREPLACEQLTLRQVMARFGLDHIDLLKLDCEGSEYAILDGAPLEAIRFILGEYHGFDRWEQFRAKHFAGWDYGHMSRNGEFGNFHLRNPHFQPLEKPPAPGPGALSEVVAPFQAVERNGHQQVAESPLARLAARRRWRQGTGAYLPANVAHARSQPPDFVLDAVRDSVASSWEQLVDGGSLLFTDPIEAERAALALGQRHVLFHVGGIYEIVKGEANGCSCIFPG